MKMRRIGSNGLTVSAMGLGCMGMSMTYGKPNDLLTGTVDTGSLSSNDFRKVLPKFQGENLIENQQHIAAFKEFAAIKSWTPAQLALTWLLAQGEDIVPIPGTKKVSYLEENIKAIELELSENELAHLNQLLPPNIFKGEKYPSEINFEV